MNSTIPAHREAAVTPAPAVTTNTVIPTTPPAPQGKKPAEQPKQEG